ncbi:hypothetical protein RJT34_05282 [Clitoria ternatea]|uniref:PH domain-containing protein n=1 Tax=Clitoria ternatea TaxID=43366 RepID=A0AAN9K2T3_CLITE
MGGAAHAMKRIPRIKFPQRHPNPSSGSAPGVQASSPTTDASLPFFSSKASTSLGGKASLQPKRTPVSKEEIEAILSHSVLVQFGGDDELISSTQPRREGLNKVYATSMLKLFSLPRLLWGSTSYGQEKVELTTAQLESLRSELADIEEREAQLKAKLQNIDGILRSARLSAYLYIRTRWAALPGEPLPLDDNDVDDWLPRFVVLHSGCLYLYLMCTDLSPNESTLLSDIVEVDKLPSFKREDDERWYSFYILTRHGLRYECSSSSKIQVDSWLSALQFDCKLESDTLTPNDSTDM